MGDNIQETKIRNNVVANANTSTVFDLISEHTLISGHPQFILFYFK